MIDLIYEPETWVAIAFLIFVGLLVKLGVPNLLFKALDDRSARIKAELDEALKLRKEAEGVLAEYRRRQVEAEKTAESIILNARVAAGDVAIAAAEAILVKTTHGAAAEALVTKGIGDLKAKLN